MPELRTATLGVSRKQIADFCRRWRIEQLAFFGSALRDDFNAESDLDILVTIAPDADWSLLDQSRWSTSQRRCLAARSIYSADARWSTVTRLRRQEILSTAEVVYEAG